MQILSENTSPHIISKCERSNGPNGASESHERDDLMTVPDERKESPTNEKNQSPMKLWTKDVALAGGGPPSPALGVTRLQLLLRRSIAMRCPGNTKHNTKTRQFSSQNHRTATQLPHFPWVRIFSSTHKPFPTSHAAANSRHSSAIVLSFAIVMNLISFGGQ